MPKAQETDSLVADNPLLEIRIPWTAGSCDQEAGGSPGRWQPRRTILVSLGVSLALWAAIAALLI
jgi:hypothetical protein